jgi:ATP phosphoribosyltransferase
MVLIAIPNKGSLSEKAMELVQQAGYNCHRRAKELMVSDPENGVDFVFLRPRDIATYVARGVIDVGITGQDLALESQADVVELLPLGFGRSKFRYAAPKGSGLAPEKLGDKRIATSYPELVRRDMAKRGLEPEIVNLDGAVEISVKLGVADVIADVVQTGGTLVQAGLEIIGDPILQSEAVVIAKCTGKATQEEVKRFLERLQGIVLARDYIMVEYDVPEAALPQACNITPGIESPTISPLNEDGWVAVKSMAGRKDVNRIMDALAELGAKGIIITDIRTCRI